MLPSNQVLNALLELGLNKYESQVYLGLICEGSATARNLSDITSIPYGKVYEVINSLATKGFLIVLPSKPMRFKAVQPSNALGSLHKHHQDKFTRLQGSLLKEL